MKAIEVQFMRKFTTSQAVKNLSSVADPQLQALLPNTSVSINECSSVVTINVLNMSSSPISSFTHVRNIVELLPPFSDSIFPSEMVQQLELIYQQLYPHLNVLLFIVVLIVLDLQVIC